MQFSRDFANINVLTFIKNKISRPNSRWKLKKSDKNIMQSVTNNKKGDNLMSLFLKVLNKCHRKNY